MKTQPRQDTSLFPVKERARARRNDPRTSWYAARGIDVNARQAMCLDGFINGPCTQHELIDRVRRIHGAHIPESTIRSGVPELVEKGYVECLGEIGTSPSGKTVNVWRRKVR